MELTRVKINEVLLAIMAEVEKSGKNIEFRLIGTAAAQMHGISLPTADIDFLGKTRKTSIHSVKYSGNILMRIRRNGLFYTSILFIVHNSTNKC